MTNSVRKKAVLGLKTGDVFTCSRTFSREDVLQFGNLTKDYNPVHYDTRWTDAKGFKSLVCHGLLTGSMICEFGGQVGWLATGMEFRFIHPVYFNETITCRVTIKSIEPNGRAQADAVFTNQDGKTVVTASMTGRLPLENEKEILSKMMEEGDPTNGLCS
ncbi:MAG: MaoC family dehydratase [Desulfamplus sp.]|nr:MaoC family dehydratase [Desulfamplus sp.]